MRGFEPPTLGTTIQCSNQLSYIHRWRNDIVLARCTTVNERLSGGGWVTLEGKLVV